MSDLSIFKIDNQTINIKDTTARQAAESAKTLATTASGNATTALNKANKLESEKADKTLATTSANGLMSAADKSKLDGIGAGSNVKSVNGQTGTVVLGADDVGALPDTTVIPTKTSDLTNDSDFMSGMTILAYGKSTWADFIAAYTARHVVYCRASSDSNPASGSQTRMAFMAYVNNESSPTNVEFQYYRSFSSHSATQQGDQVYVYKLDKTAGWTVTVRECYTRIVAGTGITATYSNGVLTIADQGIATTALNKVTELESEISALKSDLANKLYPVGSIYMSVNASNPAELFGGTWERLKDRFLLSAGDSYAAGSTGGESQHTLTVDEMPFHTHVTRLDWNNTTGWGIAASESGTTNVTVDAGTVTGGAGGNKPHNNMPPYLAVYMWKRIA